MPYINSVSASSERMHCHLLAQNMRELLRALSSVSISLLVFANGPQKGINFAVGWRRRWLHVVLQFIFIIIIVIKIRNTDAPHRRTAPRPNESIVHHVCGKATKCSAYCGANRHRSIPTGAPLIRGLHPSSDQPHNHRLPLWPIYGNTTWGDS